MKIFIGFKTKHRRLFTKYWKRQYVKFSKFEQNIKKIIKVCKQERSIEKIIFINIADTSDENNFKSFGFRNEIESYNRCLMDNVIKNKESCTLIDFHGKTKYQKDLLSTDGIHLSVLGHKKLASMIVEVLKHEKNNAS